MAEVCSQINWPKDGLVQDFINGVIVYVSKILNKADCCLIFDRYFEYSIKSDTRKKRVGQFNRSHTLSLKTPLPAKDVCMSSSTTKQNLIELVLVKVSLNSIESDLLNSVY